MPKMVRLHMHKENMIKFSSPGLIHIHSHNDGNGVRILFNPNAVALYGLLFQVDATTHLFFSAAGPAFGFADALRALRTRRSAHAGRFFFIFRSAGAAATAASGFLLIAGLP